MLTGQVKAAPRKLVKLFRDKLTGLNIFPMRSFGNSLDSTQAKRLARLATRLYIILLILAMIILALYVIVQPELLTKTFVEPSRQLYDRLAREHLDTLQCPCSSISMTYERFVQIAPAFHQVGSKSSHSLKIEHFGPHRYVRVHSLPINGGQVLPEGSVLISLPIWRQTIGDFSPLIYSFSPDYARSLFSR